MDIDYFNTIQFAVSAPLTLSGDSIISWSPQLADTGVHSCTAYVTDQDNAADTLIWNLTVVDYRKNTAPFFTTLASETADSAEVGAAYTQNLTASDLDGDPLIFEVVTGGDLIAVDFLNGTVSCTPTADDIGNWENT